MRTDCFGQVHTTESVEALAAFDAAIEGLLSHGADTAEHLRRALRHDPALPAALALNGFVALILARKELVPVARRAAEDLRRTLAERGGTPREVGLCAALEAWADGRMSLAAERLDAMVIRDPSDLMAFKLGQTCRFMLGDSHGMLCRSAAVSARRPRDAIGQGYVLGCHAFGLEEAGSFAAAEAIGRTGLERAPRDAWGLHAVAHVFEMTARTGAGIAWIEENRAAWSHCNNFRFHVSWHLALFHLGRGSADEALALYDEVVRPVETDDFRDIANASSLLWRLGQEGVPVDGRWDELGRIAARRVDDTTLVFAMLHGLLSLLGCGRGKDAERLLGNLEAFAENGAGDQARVARTIGVPLARALLESRDAGLHRQAVRCVATKLDSLQCLGGSHAQRDVFVRTLAVAAAAARDIKVMQAVLADRARLRAPDRFSKTIVSRSRERVAETVRA